MCEAFSCDFTRYESAHQCLSTALSKHSFCVSTDVSCFCGSAFRFAFIGSWRVQFNTDPCPRISSSCQICVLGLFKVASVDMHIRGKPLNGCLQRKIGGSLRQLEFSSNGSMATGAWRVRLPACPRLPQNSQLLKRSCECKRS